MEKENTEQLFAVGSQAELQMSDGAGGGVRERRKWSSTAGVGNPWNSSCRINRSKRGKGMGRFVEVLELSEEGSLREDQLYPDLVWPIPGLRTALGLEPCGCPVVTLSIPGPLGALPWEGMNPARLPSAQGRG